MTRYRHCLTACRGDAMPRSLVAVDCEWFEAEDRSNPSRLLRSLSSWHAVACLLDRGKPGRVRETHGTDAASWWVSLDWLLKRGGITWVISCPAGRAMALLGLWEGLENGAVRVTGRDYRHGRLPGGTMSPLRGSTDPSAGGHRGRTVYHVPGLSENNSDLAEEVEKPDSPLHRGSEAGYIVLEDPPTVVHARVAGTTGTIHWVDSRNYGVNTDEPEHTAAERARVLHRFALDMAGVLRSYGLGGLKDTAGSQAMAAFRRKHVRSVIVCHTVKEALNLEGAAYYGGRAEAFRVGRITGPIYHYDYRSLYPSVCARLDLPVRLRHYQDSSVSDRPVLPTNLYECIADVTLATQSPDYPRRLEGIVVWPTGRFRTMLSGPELAHAVEHGRVLAWHSVAEYDLEPALKSYALEMDAIRQEAERSGNHPIRQWAKAMGVCLPGKLGQKSRRWQTVACSPPFGYYDEWYRVCDGLRPERWRTVAGVTQHEIIESWSNDSVPAIAAWITSAGRMKLLEAIEDAGRDHVYYVDTDSLFVDEVGSERLIELGYVDADRMGYLKLEGVYSNMEIRGIKDYTIDGVHVSSGLPRGSSDVPGSRDNYWWTPWIGLATSTHRRPTADAVLKKYQRTQPYRHGTVLADGTVAPLQRWE